MLLSRRINARSILQESIWCAATAKFSEKEKPDVVILTCSANEVFFAAGSIVLKRRVWSRGSG